MKKIVILGVMMVFVLSGCDAIKKKEVVNQIIGTEAAKVKAEEFINNNLMSPGKKASIKEITEDADGMYKVTVDVDGQNIESYLSRDGKRFFPQVLDIEKFEAEAKKNKEAATATPSESDPAPVKEAPKSAKPKVELFVMSHCPYGTQIEKGIIPVVKALGDKIDFKLKFCDYAMHGEKEVMEELNQYCIDKEQGSKLFPYLEAFLVDGDSEKALAKAGVDKGKLKACTDKADKEFKVTASLNDKSSWKGSFPNFDIYKNDNAKYNVGGSPALVINGADISSARDSASLLKTICSAFDKEPAQCKTKLSSDSPAPGFGTGTGSGGSASCGN